MHSQPSWWVSNLAIPAFFTGLGATVGFFVGEIKEWLQSRRSKKAFLAAIAIEVAALKTAIEHTGQQAEVFARKLQESGHAPQVGLLWVTTVFDTQLGKLRDVADDLVLQTIETYALVERTEQIAAAVNEDSRDYVSAKAGNEKTEAQARLKSSLLVLRDESASAVPKIQALIEKLPSRKK